MPLPSPQKLKKEKRFFSGFFIGVFILIGLTVALAIYNVWLVLVIYLYLAQHLLIIGIVGALGLAYFIKWLFEPEEELS